MSEISSWLFFIVGIFCGALVIWLQLKGQIKLLLTQLEESKNSQQKLLTSRESEVKELYQHNSLLNAQLAEKNAELREVRAHADDKIIELRKAHESLSETFKGISAEALNHNSKSFMHLAQSAFEQWQNASKGQLDEKHQALSGVISPLKEALSQVTEKIHGLEVAREGAYESLRSQVRVMAETQTQLQIETHKLNKALHSPVTRGRWGEIQLKRVVELAGMLPYCDFVEQLKVVSDNGEFRPDLIVRLPADRSIVVDAKVPLDSYLKSLEAENEVQAQKYLDEHAEQLRRHILVLGKKSYWKAISPSPEFAVMFLPGEVFLSSALMRKPDLIEEGVQRGVIIATPATLIALLHAVAYGWKQDKLTDNAKKVIELAEQLNDRIGKMAEHFQKLGRNLGLSVDSYNQSIGTLETRVLSTARKLEEFGGTSKERSYELSAIEKIPRELKENTWNKGVNLA